MYGLLVKTLLILSLFHSVSFAKGDEWKAALTEALKAAYPNTRTAMFERNNIAEAGVVLVVNKPYLMGESADNSFFRPSTVENGKTSAPTGAAGFFSSSSAKELKIGTQVYVRDIKVNDDQIRFHLLTLEMHDNVKNGSTKRVRLASLVDFRFPEGQLATMHIDDVRRIIDDVFLSVTEASAPKTIALNQTKIEVEAILGQPETVIDLGAKVTYIYDTMRVIFTDGKVSDVQ